MSLRIFDGMDAEWALGAVIELRIKLLLVEAELVRLGSSPLPNYSTVFSDYSTVW